MIFVTHVDGRSEPLINIQNPQTEEEVNGGFSLSFASFFSSDNPGYALLEEESIVDIEGHEFKIKNIKETRNKKTVSAPHVFFDLVDTWRDDIYGGTRTVDEFASFCLSGTGWTWEVEPGTPAGFIPNFGENDVRTLLQTLCSSLEIEMKVMPNKHIYFAKQIGIDNDEQFRFGHNIKTLSREVDTTKLVTVGRGIGGNIAAEGEQETPLKVTYNSPNIALYGIRYGEPIVDERYTIAENLLEKVARETQDTPLITIEVSVAELNYGGSTGLGDSIWVIYEPMDLLVQLRVMKRTTYPLSNKSPVVTLSNVKETLTDQLTQTKIDINNNQKETRSRIEQTNNKILLEVNRINESIAQVVVEADNIKLSVQSLNGRMTTAESTLTIQAGEIESRVRSIDYNGVEMISRINQTSEAVTIVAGKIQLSGITEVASTLHIGAPGTSGNKSLIFNNYAGIDTFGTTSMELTAFGDMYLNCDTVRFDAYFGGGGATVDFSTASEVIWGPHAPDTTARFG